MTIREELKKLVTKLGGTPSKEDQTAELIHKVTDNVSGGGSGGGGGVLDVNITTTNWTSGTSDKTFAEIASAINAGEVINAKIVGEDVFIPLMLETFSDSNVDFKSITFLASDNLLEVYRVSITASFVFINYYTYTLTPST